MHPRIPLAFLAARAHCWLMVNLSSMEWWTLLHPRCSRNSVRDEAGRSRVAAEQTRHGGRGPGTAGSSRTGVRAPGVPRRRHRRGCCRPEGLRAAKHLSLPRSVSRTPGFNSQDLMSCPILFLFIYLILWFYIDKYCRLLWLSQARESTGSAKWWSTGLVHGDLKQHVLSL